ncbi:alpha-1-acid glycoprotein 1-like [Aptenodytes patagonicus]|uniref:alpha-1-acid glycoprotein 1-like n=1 Tax=Aptenodytes patagonicus TaxID=9234 RepID=UPI003FA11D06
MQQVHHPHHLQPRRQLAAIDAHHRQPQPRPGQARSWAQGSSLGNVPKRCWLRHRRGAGSPRHIPSPPLQGCKSKRLSEHVRLSRASLAPRSRAAMAAARVAAILGLAALLPTAAFPCGAPHPQHPDNATASKLLGTWLYVAGAAQFPRHLLEMLLIDHGYLHVEPRAGEQELLITQRVAVRDQCLTNNSTYFEIDASNTTLVKHAKTQQTVGMLINLSSEDVLLIQYQLQRERTYLGLYLYARNLSVSTAHREEFEHHAKCLGLSKEEMVYTPWRTELCQAKEIEGNNPRTEPVAAVTASPPPGTHQPGSTSN